MRGIGRTAYEADGCDSFFVRGQGLAYGCWVSLVGLQAQTLFNGRVG